MVGASPKRLQGEVSELVPVAVVFSDSSLPAFAAEKSRVVLRHRTRTQVRARAVQSFHWRARTKPPKNLPGGGRHAVVFRFSRLAPFPMLFRLGPPGSDCLLSNFLAACGCQCLLASLPAERCQLADGQFFFHRVDSLPACKYTCQQVWVSRSAIARPLAWQTSRRRPQGSGNVDSCSWPCQ